MSVRTNVYIDGWNLYYGAIKKTPYRWLDLRAVSEALLNRHCRIDRVPDGTLYDDAVVTEEKGSDVKLATHLVLDAAAAFHQGGGLECALVISNDSDVQESIDVAMTLGIHVVTCNPHDHRSQRQHLKGHDTGPAPAPPGNVPAPCLDTSR